MKTYKIKNTLIAILFILSHSLLFATNGTRGDYIKKGATVIDIGVRQEPTEIVVPHDIVEYEPTLSLIENIIKYEGRVTQTDSCIIDERGNELCPLKQEVCPTSKEYTQGTSSVGTGYLSCSQINADAYYDAVLNKCVLPPDVAKVCENNGSAGVYDLASDECRVDSLYPARNIEWTPPTSLDITSFVDQFRNFVRAAGGTRVDVQNLNYNPLSSWVSGTSYLLTTDATESFVVSVRNPYATNFWNWKNEVDVVINPGDEISLYLGKFYNNGYWYFYVAIGNGNYHEVASLFLTAEQRTRYAFVYYATNSIYFYGQSTLPRVYVKHNNGICPLGSSVEVINGINWCRDTSYFPPLCQDSTFSTRDKNKCLASRKTYSYYNYLCPSDLNEYGDAWYAIDAGGDCGGFNLSVDTNGDGIKDQCNSPSVPPNNCERNIFFCPFDNTKKCVLNDLNTTTSSGPNVNISKTYKRPLDIYGLSGSYNPTEYGYRRNYSCGAECQDGLSRVYAKDANTLCFKSKQGEESCVASLSGCTFDGEINDITMDKYHSIFSILNTKSESIRSFTGDILEDHTSPSGISLEFSSAKPAASYPLPFQYTSPSQGKPLTVSFWMNWDGLEGGSPITFEKYSLMFLRLTGGTVAFGFNTGNDDIYGIGNTLNLVGGWHHVVATFVHQDSTRNTLYVDGVEQNLTSLSVGGLVHAPIQANADISRTFGLGNYAAVTYGYFGKLADINIYDSLLNQEEVKRLYTKGSPGGIAIIQAIDGNLSGYDLDNKAIGKITSNCEWSGKVGFLKEVIPAQSAVNVLKTYENYNLSLVSDTNVSGVGCQEETYNLEFSITDTAEILFAKLAENSSVNYVSVSVNGNLVDVGPYGGNKLTLIRDSNGTATSVDTGQGTYACNVGYRWSRKYNIDIEPYLRDGLNNISIKMVYDGVKDSNVRFLVGGLKNNIICEKNCDLSYVSLIKNDIIPVVSESQKDIPSPITSMKAVDNRLEFWNSYDSKGSSGYLSFLKHVASVDKADGFLHEFSDLTYLSSVGFTAFKSYSNGYTYAVSQETMSISSCRTLLAPTTYYLAERNTADNIGLEAISALSHQQDGLFGDYCIIQKKGLFGNNDALYSVKETNTTSNNAAYYCSPLSCENYMCGLSSCKSGYLGTLIKEADRDRVLNSTICIDQDCDINLDYFNVCGNMGGCPIYNYIYPQEDGTCAKASCENGGVLNESTGKCEKTGCKNSVERNGRCYKKL